METRNVQVGIVISVLKSIKEDKVGHNVMLTASI